MTIPGFEFLYWLGPLETAIVAFLVVAFAGTFGYMTDSMMKGQGYGLVGNAIIIVIGAALGIFLQAQVRQLPAMVKYSHWLNDPFMVVVFGAGCATLLLVILAFLKRLFR
jgi:hypothetical protein